MNASRIASKLIAALVVLFFWGTADAQLTAFPNDTTTGTSLNTLTKLTSSRTAVKALTTDTSGIIGITTAGAGPSGTATVQLFGSSVLCAFAPAPSAAGDYVQISTSTAGDCRDTGSSSYPSSGQVIGKLLSLTSFGGAYAIELFPNSNPVNDGQENYLCHGGSCPFETCNVALMGQ